MKGKRLSLIAIAGIVLLFAGMSFANVPAPPVNQILGFDDTEFNALTEADCRVCHGFVGDRHHMLYGSAVQQGQCSTSEERVCEGTATSCTSDGDCAPDVECVPNPGPCLVDADCTTTSGEDICVISGDLCDPDLGGDGTCPSPWTGQYCGQPICSGKSAAPNPTENSGVYGCLVCHDQDTSGGVIEFIVYRDCTLCHVVGLNQGSVHHISASGDAKAGVCTSCHGTFVDDMADGHTIPTYNPSLVTPAPSTHGDAMCTDGITPCPNGWECNAISEICVQEPTPAGGCNYCHDAGTDTASTLDVVDNYDTHHHAGIYKNEVGGSDETKCLWCHKTGNPHDSSECYDAPGSSTGVACTDDSDCNPGETCQSGHDADIIRTCEGCHGYESLHNIQADSDGTCSITTTQSCNVDADCPDDETCTGTIIPGGELAGYGHIGADDPGGDSDCWGCHGFSTASAPGTGPITPSISSSDVPVMVAGTDTVVTLTGAAFIDAQNTADVALTAADGSKTTLTPSSITQGSLTVIIPGATTAGNYTLQVVKDANTASNPVPLTITPEVVITDASCNDGIITITGSGFGDTPPEGAGEYLNVEVDGVPVEIISWTDTEIKVSVSDCSGTVNVNALYGSDTYGDSCECQADFNSDGAVDLFDLIILIIEFGRTDCDTNSCQADCNGDGRVDLNDLIILIIEFSKGDCC